MTKDIVDFINQFIIVKELVDGKFNNAVQGDSSHILHPMFSQPILIHFLTRQNKE